jgi:SAM-dependent methyltransferase
MFGRRETNISPPILPRAPDPEQLTMGLIERIHGEYVFNRRVRVLSGLLAELIPNGARVLDVGCGDGLLAKLILERRPDAEIQGVEVLMRTRSHIPVTLFDGHVIPHPDESFDIVMFVDVLHHTMDPNFLVSEAARVARQSIIIKDHTRNGLLADTTLRLMDWVGNARHAVVLPYNFWAENRWLEFFDRLNLEVRLWKKDLNIYPRPASWLFDRSLHFIAQLNKSNISPDQAA